jgi:glycosyltransferase involved in cell wall biosynthesis
VFVWAAFPPPVGGISVHAERLARLLHGAGFQVVGFDMAGRRGAPPPLPFPRRAGRPEVAVLRLLFSWLIQPPAVVHLHVSATRRAALLFPLLVLLSRRSKIVITIHSGSFGQRVAEVPGRFRWLRRGFQSASAVIAVSAENRDLVIRRFDLPPDRVHLIPAFLAPPSVPRPPGGGPGAPRRVWLASGFGTSLYFWEGLLEAVAGLDRLDELVLVFYCRYDSPYFEEILAQAARLGPFQVTIRRDLTAEAFQHELARTTLFIRPTLTDGDSIAVREALGFAIPVVASDAVARPEGCTLFRTRDVADLRRKLMDASKPGAPRPRPGKADYSQPILELYRRLIPGANAPS